MSRCFPYPPPGYEKKGQLFETKVQLTEAVASSKKKGKRKHHEKKDKKDRREKKKRRKEAVCNGDLPDKERHGDAELVRVKSADKNSLDATLDLNHRQPATSGNCAQLKNGKVPEPESSYSAQSFSEKAELSLKNKEVKVLVASKHSSNGQAGNHVNKHLAPSNGENRTFDSAAFKAEQSSKYEEQKISAPATPGNNGKVGGHLNKPLTISGEQGSVAAVETPVESETCHPILQPVDKIQKVVNRECDRESRPPDTNAELVDSRWIDSSLTSGSGKRKHARYKGFLEFPMLPQPGDWTADCESWIFPMKPIKSNSSVKLEMQASTSQLPMDMPVCTNQACVDRENNVDLKDDSLQVWADAIFLPSVSIHALPYVVPY